MRSSLSCDICRRAKVKCVHEGSPPCQRCTKSNLSGCVLSLPRVGVSKTDRKAAKNVHRESVSQVATPAQPTPSSSTTQGEHRVQRGPRSRSPQARQRVQDYDKGAIEGHLINLPHSIILKTLNVFANKFPELAILHVPTFMKDFESSGPSSENTALLGAVLAATRAQLGVLGASWAISLLTKEQYAFYAKERLTEYIMQPPKIQVVQALLIITLHEWGSREFHKAWVYCGIAIRIMQALHSLRVAPYPLEPFAERDHRDAITVAIETRAYWGCFIMDCMVNSGTYNPPMLPMSEMRKLKIARPLSSVEFAFGPEASMAVSELQGTDGTLDITQSFEILVGGFNIWVQVMEFIFNDGRKGPGMCAPQNCPWVPRSPWDMSWNQLRAWRAGQHRNLLYPSTSVAVHMTLGCGETFTVLNLLYYVSVLMLHREYTPFLPTPESVPVGPVDPPRLEAKSPTGWWEHSAGELFGSAENIARLLHQASECGVHLMTPFAGFCAFSAGYLLVYIYHFPNMNFGRSPKAEECMKMCLDYLEEFRHVWKIADGWIKTIQHASLLYGRAATTGRYRGRSRKDFEHIHQSVHEFRVVDRSEQHTQEIVGADREVAPPLSGIGLEGFGFDDQSLDTNALLNQLLTEVSSNVDEQGPWSQWWPPMEDVELPTADPNMPMLL